MTIRLVVLDIDGVLTDGRLQLGEDLSERKSLSYRDLDAITVMALRKEPERRYPSAI